MTDRYENIRLALAMEPMPGPWLHDGDGVTADDEDVAVAMCCPSEAEAAYIAACDPDTIRELLAERDQLAAALEAAREDAARYRCLSAMATQQADYLGPIFRIDVRRSEPYLFNFDAAVDAAMRKEDK